MISVAIVDEQRDVREGLQNLLNSAEGFSCVAVFSDGEEALSKLRRVHPDVVLMDIDLTSMSGIECLKTLKDLLPEVEVVILTNLTDDDHIFQALSAGASGYLSKSIFPSKLLGAITEVVNGGAPLNMAVARRVVKSFNKNKNELTELSKRESEVMELLCQGHNYRGIASALYISPNTVRFHLKNIYRKLRVNSRHEAVLKVTNGEGVRVNGS
ncbi:MAG: DNA-binding response regulator [Bacteroidetes bacterium]|nr:MAG: DNA-binding response regulator [Bacteroidota bacterium]